MITLEVGGIRFQGFTSITVSKNIETISGSFEFEATSNNVTTFPIKRGDPCSVLVGNEQVINGFVDAIDVSYDSGSHSLSIKGRDRTCDVIDSTVIGKKEFKAPISLEQIIRTSLDDNGLVNIEVINEAGTIENFKETEFVSSEIGQTVFDFIETYARKRQVLLTTNGNGDIVIARTGTTFAATVLQNKIGGNSNNILSGRISYDETQRFNKYVVQSQQNPGALSFGADVTLGNVVDQNGEAEDTEIRTTRQLEITSKTSDTNVDLGNLALWNTNLRRARSTNYSVNVQGFFQDELQTLLWEPNILVKVDDEFADVSSILLIKSVDFNLSVSGGSITTLNLVAKDSYSLQAELDASESRANKQGTSLTDLFPS